MLPSLVGVSVSDVVELTPMPTSTISPFCMKSPLVPSVGIVAVPFAKLAAVFVA